SSCRKRGALGGPDLAAPHAEGVRLRLRLQAVKRDETSARPVKERPGFETASPGTTRTGQVPGKPGDRKKEVNRYGAQGWSGGANPGAGHDPLLGVVGSGVGPAAADRLYPQEPRQPLL